MKTSKLSFIDVFSGAPWEVMLIMNLLQEVNVKAEVSDAGMRVSVPKESYAAAARVIGGRI